MHFVAPNTDGDDELVQLDAEADAEADADADPEPEPEPAHEQYRGRSMSIAHLIDEVSFEDTVHTNAEAVFSNTAFSHQESSFTSPHDLPSIQDVLESHISPSQGSAIRPPPNDAKDIQSARTQSFTSVRPGSVSWHRSPISNPNHSPALTKRSPLESIHNASPYNASVFSPSSALTIRWPVNNAYEAKLFHHYIVNCTGWIDVCDARCHFAKEVPKRAAHFPVILHGILGLAARHLWLMGKVQEDRSQLYVDQCLQALIVALEDPLAHWDENFLVAVILLRLHEEMGEADELCHHFGTARILNSISSFAADGGLRESASWISLRQHIFVSLTTQQPLNLSLENYRHSSVFREFDDESWANRIIFLFATVLQAVFHTSGEVNSLNKEKWEELDADVDEWERTKPWSFCAIHIEPNAGERFNGSWPSLPCAQGVVAVGCQYYHLCKILLTIYSPNASLVGLAGVRARKATDTAIRRHMRIIIGYGVSNTHCGNTMFQGSHILSACGAYVVDEKEQEACIEYLTGLQTLIGWRTDKVLADLKEQWLTS